MEQAATLIRGSSDKQDEQNQVSEVTAHSSQYDVVRRFELHGVSASKAEHEAVLAQILDDMRAGKYTVLVVAHSSRLDRRGGAGEEVDITEQIQFLLDVRAAGGRVESAREPQFGTLDLAGLVTTVVAQHANAQYSRTLKGHVNAAVARIHDNGALHGRPPWGYSVIGDKLHKQLVPTDAGREYVPQIFARVIKGDSLRTIARWLESENVSPVGISKDREDSRGKSGQWWPRTLGEMIANPTYAGRRCEMYMVGGKRHYGKTLHKCDALVDAGVWDRANKALDSHPKRGASNPETRAMLSGVLYCGMCDDSPMYRIRTKDGEYYRCSGRGAARKGCGNMVVLSKVDEAASQIVGIWFNSEIQERTLVPGNEAELDARLAELKLDIRQLDPDDSTYEVEHARLMAARDAVRDTERTLDRWTATGTGRRYADVYEGLPSGERGPWLRGEGFKVDATKAEVGVSGVQPDSSVVRISRFALAI